MRPRLHCNFEQFSTNSYPVFAHFRSTFSSRNSTTFSAELCVVVDESWEIFNFHHQPPLKHLPSSTSSDAAHSLFASEHARTHARHQTSILQHSDATRKKSLAATMYIGQDCIVILKSIMHTIKLNCC